VARHIDKPETQSIFFEESKTQIDRDAAPFLFFQAVGMCSGQRLDQRGFSVIDMPGSSNNDAFQGVIHSRAG
jgi:hypothetical protein